MQLLFFFVVNFLITCVLLYPYKSTEYCKSPDVIKAKIHEINIIHNSTCNPKVTMLRVLKIAILKQSLLESNVSGGSFMYDE